MVSTPRFGFVLEYVDDVAAARPFYTDVLGLRVERESPEFIQFSDPAGVGFAIASDASLSGTREPEMYWVVDDATTAMQALPKGVTLSHSLENKPFGTVFGIIDPAGQTQFVVEFARHRPSKAVDE